MFFLFIYRHQQQTVWPLSLLAYRAATRALALDPTPTIGDSISIKMDPALKPINLLCRLHVKKKKKHEILRMAEVSIAPFTLVMQKHPGLGQNALSCCQQLDTLEISLV